MAPPLDVRGALLEVVAPADIEFGVPPRMFRSATLDRFLRKAQQLFSREDFAGAIRVLQDVLEGRVEPGALAGEPLEGTDGTASGQPEDEAAGEEAVESVEDDPRHAVYSADERVFRPVRGLCHELLTSMPPVGRTQYRQMYEVSAERAFEAAMAVRDRAGLERVYDSYFVTHAAARAMAAAADLLMHDGRFRAAAETLRLLLEVYPDELRRQVPEADESYLRIRLALCLAMMGETDRAAAALARLREQRGDEAVRVMGELVAVDDLAEGPLLSEADRVVPPSVGDDASAAALDAVSTRDALVPLWEFRFTETDPYRPAVSEGRRVNRFGPSTGRAGLLPRVSQYSPATTAMFDGDRLVFLDHFRLRVSDLDSGMMLLETGGLLQAPTPQQGHPRVRIAAYDWGNMQVVADGQRYYCVLGPGAGGAAGYYAVLNNELVAYDRTTLAQVWTSHDRAVDRARRPSFMAAPAVYGNQLLAPVLIDDAYALLGMDSATGQVLFETHLHMGGTDLVRAPGSPVVVDGGTAYVLTNAGGIGAVDVFSGQLRWVRRYERTHPIRPNRARQLQTQTVNQGFARETSLYGFVPAAPVVLEGRVIVAPADGEVLVCLDGATGDLLWVSERQRDSKIELLGHNQDHLYLRGERYLVCVDHRSGILRWSVEVPADTRSGRGAVGEAAVLLPGDRCVFVMPSNGEGRWRRLALPVFGVSREPLPGGFNVFLDEAYLLCGYAGGIEMFGLRPELLAELDGATVEQQIETLVLCGETLRASALLAARARDEALSLAQRARAASRGLALVRESALTMARRGDREAGVAALGECRAWLPTRALRMQWHLARIDLFEALRDSAAMEREQDALYAMMEGRG